MKYKTLKNIERATRMIVDKGYNWETANRLAINSFKAVQINNFCQPVEFYIDKILSKEEFDREYGLV